MDWYYRVGEGQSTASLGWWDNFILSDCMVDGTANKSFVLGTQGVSVEDKMCLLGWYEPNTNFLALFLRFDTGDDPTNTSGSLLANTYGAFDLSCSLPTASTPESILSFLSSKTSITGRAADRKIYLDGTINQSYRELNSQPT